MKENAQIPTESPGGCQITHLQSAALYSNLTNSNQSYTVNEKTVKLHKAATVVLILAEVTEVLMSSKRWLVRHLSSLHTSKYI